MFVCTCASIERYNKKKNSNKKNTHRLSTNVARVGQNTRGTKRSRRERANTRIIHTCVSSDWQLLDPGLDLRYGGSVYLALNAHKIHYLVIAVANGSNKKLVPERASVCFIVEEAD